MKTRILAVALLPLALTSCLSIQDRIDRRMHGDNPYAKAPFYMRYVGRSTSLDRQITRLVNSLKNDPHNAALHNDLGALLLEKGFPGDATREFRRAINDDEKLYSAWYNLGLVRETQGDYTSAERALKHTVELKPGHAAAHFQLGLIHEKRGRSDAAIHEYAKAFHYNRGLLDVRLNPRLVDSKLIDLALLSTYDIDHAETSAEFQATPAGYTQPRKAATPPADSSAAAQPSATNTVSPTLSPSDLTNQASRPTSPSQSNPPKPKQNANAAPIFTLRPNASAAATTP